MNKKRLLIVIKKIIKIFVQYTIENDYKIYRIKNTKINIRFSLQKRYQRKWGDIPIQKNKIIFDNYMGMGYGCNCKYVVEQLLKKPNKYELVWVVKDVASNTNYFPPNIRLVEYMSEEAFMEYATAGIWICNYHLVAYLNKGLQKKEGQIYIQLWHGSFGIKKIEGDCRNLVIDRNWEYLAKKNADLTDFWISNSDFETRIYKRAFWNVKNIKEYGHPRNDIFFTKYDSIIKKVKKELGISFESKMVLYVPTFRDNGQYEGEYLDSEMVVGKLEERFGDNWEFVVRYHPKAEFRENQMKIGINATNYPDIQELLAAADTVITDYSSCIFDFLLTGRPGFIYTTDSDMYNEIRGLYYPLKENPFMVAENNKQLCENIDRFDEKVYEKRVKQFLNDKGSVEDGHAAERLEGLIKRLVRNEKNEEISKNILES